MSLVIATAWSRDGSRCYMRTLGVPGIEPAVGEFIWCGSVWMGSVRFNQVVPLHEPCECGMCSVAERILDEEYPPRRRRRFETDEDQPEDFE